MEKHPPEQFTDHGKASTRAIHKEWRITSQSNSYNIFISRNNLINTEWKL